MGGVEDGGLKCIPGFPIVVVPHSFEKFVDIVASGLSTF
jgi:hypothetical protein